MVVQRHNYNRRVTLTIRPTDRKPQPDKKEYNRFLVAFFSPFIGILSVLVG